MSGTSRLSFLLYDAGGSALWAGAYTSGSGIPRRSPDTLLLVLGAPLVLFFTWKVVRLLHMIRQLEPLYITPERLKERLDNRGKCAVGKVMRAGRS